MRANLLDTYLDSPNTGDLIIVNSVLEHFPSLKNSDKISTHKFQSISDLITSSRSEALVLTGTNVLSSTFLPPQTWKFGPLEWLATKGKVVGVGLGWRDYEGEISRLQKAAYHSIFKSNLPVSTRDEYSAQKLLKIGVDALNTACPTMWNLPLELPRRSDQEEVVATVTDYRESRPQDEDFLRILGNNFKRVLLWPQGSGDTGYLSRLDLPGNYFVLEPGLDAFDEAVVGRVYVGTRLHAGIRASQLGCPSVVISIDNRAAEIGLDTGFPVVSRNRIGADLQEMLESLFHSKRLTLPLENINKFKHAATSAIGL
jgi:hypothetical protein